MGQTGQGQTGQGATAWRIEARTGSGHYIVSERGAILFRFDRESGLIFAWDKQGRCEVLINVTAVFTQLRVGNGVSNDHVGI